MSIAEGYGSTAQLQDQVLALLEENERLRREAVERELIVAAALDALEATPGVGYFRATASALRKTINAASAATCEQGANT